jgi:hypothetical protein
LRSRESNLTLKVGAPYKPMLTDLTPARSVA